jgi:outer membrane receptor protein involved in Fe transport
MEHAGTAAKYMPAGYAVFDSFMTWKPFENVTFRAGVLNIFVVAGYNRVPTTASA